MIRRVLCWLLLTAMAATAAAQADTWLEIALLRSLSSRTRPRKMGAGWRDRRRGASVPETPRARRQRPRPTRNSQPAASISFAISNMFVTLFQLRAVPVTLNNLSTEDHGSFDLPAPFGK